MHAPGGQCKRPMRKNVVAGYERQFQLLQFARQLAGVAGDAGRNCPSNVAMSQNLPSVWLRVTLSIQNENEIAKYE